MPYYPKHFIKTNLYTNGGEFELKGTDKIYTGNYWQTGNGRYFTGATPQTNPTFELIPINRSLTEGLSIFDSEPLNTQKVKLALEGDAPEVGDGTGPYNSELILEYLKSQNRTVNDYPNRYLPYYNLTLPTNEDYNIGEFRRFFCKKINDISYIELDRDTYFSIVNKNPKIVYELYIPFNLPWKISGNKEDVYKVNRNITEYSSIKFKLPKLGEYLKFDYLKYYK